MDIVKASIDFLTTPLPRHSCNEFKKETIRPFSLQYLALGAVLGNNLDINDSSKNELLTNKHLFETDSYKKLLQNAPYNVFEDKHCLEFNETVRYERVKRWICLCDGANIYRYILRKQTERCSGYTIVRPWCKCKSATFKSRCVEDTYYCTEYERIENAHYSSCDQSF